MRPTLPSWIRSSKGNPHPRYFFATETTSLRFFSMSLRRAFSSPRLARLERSISSWGVRRLPCPICLRYFARSSGVCELWIETWSLALVVTLPPLRFSGFTGLFDHECLQHIRGVCSGIRPTESPKVSTSSSPALSSREGLSDPTEPSHDRCELAPSKSMILPNRKYDLSRERREKRCLVQAVAYLPAPIPTANYECCEVKTLW